MGVAFDLQPVQSRQHGERGIARYVLELASALRRHHPDSVEAYLLNADLPVPGSLDRFAGDERIQWSDRQPSEVDVFHLTSPFELGLPLDRVWPLWARARCRLIVTLYDVIPLLYSEHYHDSSVVAAHYRTRLEIIRRADKVLAISEATASDAISTLGLRPSRVHVVGAAPSDGFRPPESTEVARAEVSEAIPGIRPGYLLYTGGVDWRKNIHGLVQAFSALPAELRRRHQLVIVCSVSDEHRIRYSENLSALGIANDVLFTGRVSDADLVRLYQAAELFVFPSIYEGYGLPVAEALASGTAVLCSRSSSLLELVDDDEALFDPTDPDSIRDSMQAALEDPARLERLRRRGRSVEDTWEGVADATAAVYREVSRRPPRRRPRRPRLAAVSPLPPTASGVADYTLSLLTHLRDRCDIDVFVDATEIASTSEPDGIGVHAISTFPRIEAIRNGFDRILYCIGNQTSHAGALALLRHRPGAVLAHDLRLTGVYAWCAQHRADLVPDGFAALLHELHPGPLPASLGDRGFLDYREADEHAIFMARRVIEESSKFLTHASAATERARIEAGDAHASKVRTLPFAFPPVERRSLQSDELVASFGVADPIKQTPKVLEAFAVMAAHRPDARFAIVGPMPEVVQAEYMARASDLGVADRVTVTGRVSTEEYRRWLRLATLAIQLRASWGGEASAAVADCLANGVPTIATATGWTADLPADAVVLVAPDVTADALGQVAAELLEDAARRRRLREAGWRHAEANSFARVADVLYRQVVLGPADPVTMRLTEATTASATAAGE